MGCILRRQRWRCGAFHGVIICVFWVPEGSPRQSESFCAFGVYMYYIFHAIPFFYMPLENAIRRDLGNGVPATCIEDER